MIGRLAGAALAVVFGLGCKKTPAPGPAAPPASGLDHAGETVAGAAQSARERRIAPDAGVQAQRSAAANLPKAMQVLADGNSAGLGGVALSPRELKALLPEALSGLKRTRTTGKQGGTSMDFTQANADYRGDAGAQLDIELVDFGAMTGPLALGIARWASLEFDRHDETGYEKSTVLGGNKAFEKYDTRSKHGMVKVLIGNRFVVVVKGRNVTVEDMKGAAGTLNAKLAALKP